MLFSTATSDSLNTSSTSTLNTSLPQSNSAVLSSTVASGLVDPLQQPSLTASSNVADLVVATGIPSTTIAPSVVPDWFFPIIPVFSTPGGSTLATATNLGTLNGTQSLYDLDGVSSSKLNDYYRITLGANSNFNLSMTGLTADANVQFLNGIGQEIAHSSALGAHDEAINLAGLASGDYYIRVYQNSGNTGFSLNLSSTVPSNLLPREFELGTVYPGGATRTATISNNNTADVYHFSVDGFASTGDVSPYYNSSNVNISLTGLSGDADIRLIRDANHNGIIDPGDEITRSAVGGSSPESINLAGLGIGDYYLQVYQYNGSTTPYTLNVSANGGHGYFVGGHTTESTAYDVHTLNGTRVFEGHVSGQDPIPGMFGGYPRNPNDYYHFNLGTTSNLNLRLDGLVDNADVQILKSTGTIAGSYEIAGSYHTGTTAESLDRPGLEAGDYYVRVYPSSTSSTGYTLTLTANPGLG